MRWTPDKSDEENTEHGRAGDPGPQQTFTPEDWVSPHRRDWLKWAASIIDPDKDLAE